MKSRKAMISISLVAIGIAIGASGLYFGETDDSPGASLLAILLMIGAVTLGVRTALRRT